jgi:hypothetical protein
LGAATDLKAWAGVLMGPLAWTMQLLLSYPLAQLSCHAGFTDQHSRALHVIAIGALAAIGGGVWASMSVQHQVAAASMSSDGGHTVDRLRFMALLGLATCALFACLVLFTWTPPFLLHDCQ